MHAVLLSRENTKHTTRFPDGVPKKIDAAPDGFGLGAMVSLLKLTPRFGLITNELFLPSNG